MRVYLTSLILCVLALASTAVRGDSITWKLAGDLGDGCAPEGYLWVTISSVTPGTVTLTVESELQGTEWLTELVLNFDPSLDPTDIGWGNQQGSGFAYPIINTGQDSYRAGGGGQFDIMLQFAKANAYRFDNDDTYSVDFTLSDPAITKEHFINFSTTGGEAGPFYAAAHIGGTGDGGEDSSWSFPVPEASTLLLFGSGLSGLMFFARKKGLIKV